MAASVVAFGLGGVVWAEEQQQQQQQTGNQLTGKQIGQQYGGSGQEGAAAQQQQQQETAELKGTVVKYGNKLAHLKLEQGAVVPVKITSQTQFEGLEQQQQGTGGSGQQQQQQSQSQKQLQKQALQQLAPGDQLTATVTTQKGENVAQKIKFDESKGKEQQLDGKIARASGTMVDVDYNGAIVPLKVDKDTQFTGVKSARELKEGDQIRASFKLENGTSNVATKIEAEKKQQ